VLRWGPFLWRCSTCIILFIGLKEWPSSLRCFAKLGLVIVSESGFVFFLSRGESSTILSDVSFVAIGAGEFVCS